MSELLSSDGLIRRLKKGAPILLQKETIRLPRFTEIKEVDQKEVGGKGREPIVVARSRTATWALLPWSKKSGFDSKDAQAFLKMVEALQQQNPAKPIKGYVIVANGPVEDKGAALLEQAGHLASAIAE